MRATIFSSTALAVCALLSLPATSAHAQDDAVRIAPAPSGMSLYYIVTRPDFRRCAFPLCGGFYVKAVNQTLTRCADGRWQRDCYVAELNTDALGWTPEQRASFTAVYRDSLGLVKGNLTSGLIGEFQTSWLTAGEAWQAQARQEPSGTFYGVKSTGIVCVTTPCPSLAAVKLNSPLSRTFNPELDLAASGAGDAQVQAGYEALSTSGVLTAGTVERVKYPALDGRSTRWGSKIVASEFYLPAKP